MLSFYYTDLVTQFGQPRNQTPQIIDSLAQSSMAHALFQTK